MFSRRVSTKLSTTRREERLCRYMLSPTDIRSAVREVLLSADRGLCAYEILESLPTHLRGRIITERGLPGAGNGKRYTAASLVTDSVEALLTNLEPPHRVYVNASSLTYEVARSIVRPGNVMIAYYRLTNVDVDSQPVVPIVEVPTSVVSELKSSSNLLPSTKVPWYDQGGWIGLWLLLVPPVGVYGFIRSNTISKKVKQSVFAFTIIALCVGSMVSGRQESAKDSYSDSSQSVASDPQPTFEKSNPINKPAKEPVGVWITKDGFLSADTNIQLSAAAQSASRRDEQALNRLINVGAVTPLKPGLKVRTIGHEGFPPTMVKVRVVGEQTEYWTFPEALKRGW